MTVANQRPFSYQLPLAQRLEQQETEDQAIVAGFTATDRALHDRAQGYKLFLARRLYQLSREGIFPQTPVRLVKNRTMVEQTDALVRVGEVESDRTACVFVEPDGAMKTGGSFASGSGALGIDLQVTRPLTEAEYVTWAPRALTAIRGAMRQHVDRLPLQP